MVGLYGHVIYTLNIAINSDNPLIEQVIIDDGEYIKSKKALKRHSIDLDLYNVSLIFSTSG